jgi:hypothetical protein
MLGGGMMLVLCGCASVSVQTNAYLGSPRYSPTQPAAVQILPAEPNQPKERLGEIVLGTVGNASRDDLEKRLKTAAARLGADAVFVSYDKTHVFPVVYYDWCWPPWVSEDVRRNIVAVAIKLK